MARSRRLAVALGVTLANTLASGCDDGTHADSQESSLGTTLDASVACSDDAGNVEPPTLARCAADNGGIELPSGFCASVFADHLGAARHLAVTPHGDVYVAVKNAEDGSKVGGVVALRDADGDGVAEQIERFGDDGGNGIAYHDGALYYAEDTRVLRYDLKPGELKPSATPVTVVRDLPASGDHLAKAIVVHGNHLYVNVGSATNSCQVDNRELESPGIDPCPELSTRAGVWKFAAGGRDQKQADAEQVIVGGRNLTALALNPHNQELYAAVNGRDQLFENWPKLFTEADDKQAPSEELVRLRAGDDYGWPYCYHDARVGQRVLAPEYGGDGKTIGRCAETVPPVGTLPAHWAPLGMHFYQGDAFPARYREGAFVASHGSRFDPNASGSLPGYNVVFVPFEDDVPVGGYEEFALDFAGPKRPLPDAAEYRPVGLAEANDGSLYISDDKVGRVWRVFYRGGAGRDAGTDAAVGVGLDAGMHPLY